VTIILSSIVGPMIAMALYGGQLDDGQRSKPWIQWVVTLSDKVKSRFGFDNKAFANSGLARSLEQRLHFDRWYDAFCLKIIVGLSNFAAIFDKKVIDGAIKTVETTSQATSKRVRALTTGSARDYIMMAALGTISIFILLWGVI